jgi:predicted dehydrogenase
MFKSAGIMQQLLQSLADGRIVLEEIPVPTPAPSAILIKTSRSMLSSGTERMLLDFGRAGWIDKVRQQPEKAHQVFDKMRADGVLATLEAVRSKLDQPIPLGYCNVGRVAEIGAGVSEFAVGDRVVSNGPHAQYVAIGRNLCARIPDSVGDDEAVFVPLAAIALQGLRLAGPAIGEHFCVIGLGVIGLIAVQLLRASGCKVLAVDPDPGRAALARRFGAGTVDFSAGEDVLKIAERFSAGRGIDAVLITAATDSDEPVAQAARMCRQRGRIVLTGVTGLKLDRADFYKKEISFQVSCSYGPGRYDEAYEGRGIDYPFGLVRWTAQRNFQAVLQLMEGAQLDVRPLISHRFAFGAAGAAYDLLADRTQPSLGIVLDYVHEATTAPMARSVSLRTPGANALAAAPSVAFIGAGNYAGRVLIPAFQAAGVRLVTVATANGISAARYGRRYGFEAASTDVDAVFATRDVDLIVIATRHDTHAQFVQRAILAGKHVFVEKPLALNDAELDAIEAALQGAAGRPQRTLMVGFNRRFAVLAMRMKSLLGAVREPKTFVITVNAGAAPPGHWTIESAGGGRVVGEACHFIDLLRFLAGCPITGSAAQRTGGGAKSADPSVCITLNFADGSLGTIHYLTAGHASFPKERIEAFAGGRVLQLDNFRRLRAFGWPGFTSQRLWRQDKGQSACVAAVVEAIKAGNEPPIPLEEILEVSRAAIAVSEAARH